MEEIVRLQGTISEQRSRIAFLEGEGEKARNLIGEKQSLELQVARLEVPFDHSLMFCCLEPDDRIKPSLSTII